MKKNSFLQTALASLAALGCCMPQLALATETASANAPTVIDVTLHEGGLLVGQVVDPQGRPVAEAAVSLQDTQRELAACQTNQDGYFALQGLRGGVCQVVVAEGRGFYRLWVPGTAPPNCQAGALVVAGQDAVRGQIPLVSDAYFALGPMLSSPWVIGAAVGTAIAVPVALAAEDDGPASP